MKIYMVGPHRPAVINDAAMMLRDSGHTVVMTGEMISCDALALLPGWSNDSHALRCKKLMDSLGKPTYSVDMFGRVHANPGAPAVDPGASASAIQPLALCVRAAGHQGICAAGLHAGEPPRGFAPGLGGFIELRGECGKLLAPAAQVSDAKTGRPQALRTVAAVKAEIVALGLNASLVADPQGFAARLDELVAEIKNLVLEEVVARPQRPSYDEGWEFDSRDRAQQYLDKCQALMDAHTVAGNGPEVMETKTCTRCRGARCRFQQGHPGNCMPEGCQEAGESLQAVFDSTLDSINDRITKAGSSMGYPAFDAVAARLEELAAKVFTSKQPGGRWREGDTTSPG